MKNSKKTNQQKNKDSSNKQKHLSGVLFILTISFFLLLTLSLVSANLLYCLSDGEKLPPNCVGTACRYTCHLSSGQGFCQVCTTNLGTPGVDPLSCGDMTCSFLDGSAGGGAVDPNPPVLIINNPSNGETYDANRIIFDLTVDSASRIEYRDASDTSWHKLCDGCTKYNRHVSVEEGQNQITIRATKFNNNMETEKTITFSVDSKAPDCKLSTPVNNEYSDGKFTVEYSEANLDRVELYYMGVADTSYKKALLTCLPGEDQTCSTNVNLEAYKNSLVNYYFNVCDKASCDPCKSQIIRVASNAPPILEIAPIPSLNADKKILFDILADKFVSMYYIDNSKLEQKPKTLCKNCESYNKFRSFNDGEWDITIYAEDESKRQATPFNAKFSVDTKIPIIQKTYPKNNEFTSGLFAVIFKEQNPKTLVLHYGDDEFPVALAQCTESKKKHTCEVDISTQIKKYNGEVISYWFELTDKVGNEAKYKTTLTTVDTTPPVLNELIKEQNGRKIEFALDITELNFDEVLYVVDQESDSKARWKLLCSKLQGTLCIKSVTLREGTHTIDFQIFDDAGNSIGTQEEITV